MNDTPKKGLFKRWFGGEKTKQPPPPDVKEEIAQEQKPLSEESVKEEAPVKSDLGVSVEKVEVEAETKEVPAVTLPEAQTEIIQPTEAPPPAQTAKPSWFSRLRKGLSRSSTQITGGIGKIFTDKKLSEDVLQELEDILIQADFGIDMSERVCDKIRAQKFDKNVSPKEVQAVLSKEVADLLAPSEKPLDLTTPNEMQVILAVGVNGSGKTTTIGKIGAKASAQGAKVVLAAGDTFRAAAIEQLHIWGTRIGAHVISHPHGSDAASVAFDAVKYGKENNADFVLIDTAGRLQNKTHLMEELAKVIRVLRKQNPKAPHQVILVLDATTGQNALSQTEVFAKSADVTGIVMTKLDGTARGGILVPITEKYNLPIHAIGIGESIDDLQDFSADAFAEAMVGK